MARGAKNLRWALAAAWVVGIGPFGGAADIGQIKIANGPVTIERNGSRSRVRRDALQPSDVVRTGADGSSESR